MPSIDEFATEVVLCATLFRQGRDGIAQDFPQSVVDMYDAVVARPDWRTARTLTEQALVVARVLMADPGLASRYQADVDAGRLGFGAGENPEIDQATGEVTTALQQAAQQQGQQPQQQQQQQEPGESRQHQQSDGGGLLGGGPSEPWHPGRRPDLAPPSGDESTGGATNGGGAPSAEPPSPGSPPPEPTATDDRPDTIHTWLNAELAAGTLEVGRPHTFEVFFGERSATAQAVATAIIPIAHEQESIDLTVQLVSSDFTVPAEPQVLTVRRSGASDQRASFTIVALHAGPSTLTVTVDVKGNFLQRLDVTFDVGSDAAAQVDTYGRPLAAAEVLGERTATMQFLPTAGGYQLIAPQVSPDPIDIQITPDELAARIAGVRNVLLSTVQNPAVALNLDLTPDDNAAALDKLAFQGFLLFTSIFMGSGASPQLVAAGRWLLTESKRDDFTTLQVVSKGFPVPWALMYLTEDYAHTPPSWDNFIGMRCVVEQVPMLQITTAPPDPRIESSPDLTVRALFNDGIDQTMASRPVAAQRSYWEGRGVRLTEGTSADDLIQQALATTASDKVLYFYCHAEASSQDPAEARLILTGSQSVSLGQLQVFAPWSDALSGHPLVFINACESGELTPIFYDGFVPYFLAKGARGVIGTETKTPGLFASEWAKAFFDDLFTGKALGKVVLDQRRRFLVEHRNPLGLLYGVHCDTDTVVDPALAPVAAPTP